jgi:hypothetical protein
MVKAFNPFSTGRYPESSSSSLLISSGVPYCTLQRMRSQIQYCATSTADRGKSVFLPGVVTRN